MEDRSAPVAFACPGGMALASARCLGKVHASILVCPPGRRVLTLRSSASLTTVSTKRCQPCA